MTRNNFLGLDIFKERSAYSNYENLNRTSGQFVPPLSTCIKGIIKGDCLLELAHWYKEDPKAYESKMSEFIKAIAKNDCHMSRKDFLALHDNYTELASVKHSHNDLAESRVLDDYFHICHLVENKYVSAHPFTGSLALMLHKTKTLDGKD